MNLLPGTQRLTTTDVAIGTSGNPIRVFSVHLVSGATAGANFTFYNGTTTQGTAQMMVNGTISQGVTLNINGGMRFASGCYVGASTNASYATVVYTEEF